MTNMDFLAMLGGSAPDGDTPGTISHDPEQWPAGCDPAPTNGTFEAELAWILQPTGITPEALELGGFVNPFAPEDAPAAFEPFRPGQFIWPLHGELRRCKHRRRIERHLWQHRALFAYAPRSIR
ncbi:hypothetical protein [Tsukamurella strandjordii]|uniref:Uncharacterized protein n=1 Tax=Tsukamurella strandjordii TaxID=147577 RepID=A0AA90NCE2_9ACTN|nr:hypothetical protein [Tsukamurella strandjordii]MDP0399190.1 hypothetical protein [Tsukamurella strandjordii]